MMVRIPQVLSREQVAQCRDALDAAPWIAGEATDSPAKRNRRLPESSPIARALGNAIQDALACNAAFFSAALPLKVFPPRFHRDTGDVGGNDFGAQIDDAIRVLHGTGFRVRCDLSATLFLVDPETYDGGELCVDDTYGTHRVKLPAGDMLLCPASNPHRLTPVTRGVRIASCFWIQSMVRDDTERALLHQLDNDVQRLGAERGTNDPAVVSLTGLYHNLLRRWVGT